MILDFPTHFPEGLERVGGKPTYFIAALWRAVLHGITMNADQFIQISVTLSDQDKRLINTIAPKIHTLRKDEENIWHAGMIIEAVTNAGTPQERPILPEVPCISTQKLQICHYSKEMYGNRAPDIQVDDIRMTPQAVEQMALNDGFECVEDFFAYFNKDWKGKIIHLTDFRY